MSVDAILPINFEVEDIGKHVKGTKKRFTWELALKGKQHLIVLEFSFISGKVKLTVDRKILIESELPANTLFQYPFTLDGSALNVIQQGENFELRVNNKVFSHLINQMKTNSEFKRYEDEVKNIIVDPTAFKQKESKVVLNIGAFGGGMKKKANKYVEGSAGEADWGAFDGNFPNYFGNPNGEQSAPTSSSQAKNTGDLLGDVQASPPNIIAPPAPSAPEPVNDFNSLLSSINKPAQKAETDLFSLNMNAQPQPNNFNTMQNMFATQQPLDFMNSSTVSTASKPSQSGSIDALYAQSNFNTMQNMFATQQAPNIDFMQSVPTPQQNYTMPQQSTGIIQPNMGMNQPQPQSQVLDFNTMQNMFGTQQNVLSTQQNVLGTQQNVPVMSKPQITLDPLAFLEASSSAPQPQQFATIQLQKTASPAGLGMDFMTGVTLNKPQEDLL